MQSGDSLPEPTKALSWPSNPDDLPRRLAGRAELQTTLQQLFPNASGELSPIVGGWAAAQKLLAAVDPGAYGRSRNHLEGAVTRLSPYIRHGVLGLAAVRDAVLARITRRLEGEKLINELGWRDYWQRLWQQLGEGIWENQEPLKTGHPESSYANELPADIAAGQTGQACMDAFADELTTTGWLHNHARMWLASYVVHWRRVRWQAGARWFLQHLIDGDPASNNLSWQWVASSFSHKPYIFNRANLERFGAGVHCEGCAAARRCPFEASYEALEQRLFAMTPSPRRRSARAMTPSLPPHAAQQARFTAPILWIHGEGLGPANPALVTYLGRPAVFVFDAALIEGAGPMAGSSLSLKRLGFLYECLLELPVTLRRGDVAAEVIAFARRHSADGVITSAAVDPHFAQLCAAIQAELPLQVLPLEPFVELGGSEPGGSDLRRFSRYWRRAEPLVWQHWSERQVQF